MASRQPVPTVVAALQALRERPDAKANLNKIHVPTLVVVGEEDAITPPKEAQEIVQQVPNARLVVVPGLGHLSNLEAPSFFNHVVHTFLPRLLETTFYSPHYTKQFVGNLFTSRSNQP